MYLFFDTETTGLPPNWNAPLTNLDNWPRLVQLGYILHDLDGKTLAEESFIIKPVGFTIPLNASNIHGITTEIATRDGIDLPIVLNKFHALAEKASVLVAHNMSFDEKIVDAEFLRAGRQELTSRKKKVCTMKSSTNFCAIPGPYGYKWPRLIELHQKLFLEGFDKAHNAAADVSATSKCFWELKRLGIIKGE